MIFTASMLKVIRRLGNSDVPYLLLIALTLPLFFYKLGQSSLTSWDEAWYAEVSRNILKSGDWFYLTFNGKPYTDHPFLGFWLEAISFKILGINEFSARFPSALAGFLTLIAVFYLGKELFNRYVSILAALALVSAPWFLYRARTGNLDNLLVLFFILTIYFAIKASKSEFYLVPFSLSLGGLLFSKTLVPFTILPSLIVIFWRTKIDKAKLFLSIFFPVVLFLKWFNIQQIHKDDFTRRYFMIGFPEPTQKHTFVRNLGKLKILIHNGIGKWFWPGIFSLLGGLFLFQKRFFILITFSVSFFAPFLFSDRGGIWHLIPLYPMLTLGFTGFFYVLLERIFNNSYIRSLWRIDSYVNKRLVVFLPIILVVGFYSYRQIKQNWYQFINISANHPSEVLLSIEASKYPYHYFQDIEEITPVAVFYSGKNSNKIYEGEIKNQFYKPERFLLITKQERLDKFKIPSHMYKILKEDQDKILVLKT